ncbi:hypothetical protein ACJROX_28360 [Pseudalkalibacillus sp. A8]|uniref:hypothetical protein n=1 Tax=Pseudalkalibacillus sp. A8 TaxID=3382641 RepID=UPI0038B46BF8
MPNNDQFTNSTENSSIQEKMEDIWRTSCRTWQNCNVSNVLSFLSQCQEHNIDPQFCMSWVEQHSDKIPNWQEVSNSTLNWINEHTSTGSPITE